MSKAYRQKQGDLDPVSANYMSDKKINLVLHGRSVCIVEPTD
jgi:hypothetical protein